MTTAATVLERAFSDEQRVERAAKTAREIVRTTNEVTESRLSAFRMKPSAPRKTGPTIRFKND